MTASRPDPSASPPMKSFHAVPGICCGKCCKSSIPASQGRPGRLRLIRDKPSSGPKLSGEVFRGPLPAMTRKSRGTSHRRTSGPCNLPLRFAAGRPTGGAPRGRFHVSKNIRQCMTISARTAARVPDRDIAAIATGATLPKPAPQPGSRRP